jgi:hypothetical protein
MERLELQRYIAGSRIRQPGRWRKQNGRDHDQDGRQQRFAAGHRKLHNPGHA